MQITLNKLTLKDFQGGTFTLEPNGKDVSLYGYNETGKTRLESAFTWLLSGKDSLGRTDFAIKNLKTTGEAEHGLEHSVEGVFDIDPGDKINTNRITLKKSYHETWTKKRRSTKSEMTGHTTDHWVNGVSVPQKDFIEKVREIVGDEKIFRLLTSPTAFPALPELPTLKNLKMNQRAILMEMCGELSNDEIMASDKALVGLAGIIGDRSIDEHRKIITARKTVINKEIEKIPVKIEENNRALPNVSGLNQKELNISIHDLEEEINEKKLELQGVDTGGRIAEISKKLNIARFDIQRMETDWHNDKMKAAGEIDRQILDIERDIQAGAERTADIKKEVDIHKKHIVGVDTELAGLRTKWTEIDGSEFQDTTKDTCPACRQALPSEQVATARHKALADFNQKKAERLSSINRRGEAIAEEKELLQTKIEALNKTLTLAETSEAPVGLEELKAERDALEKHANEYTFDPDYISLSGHVKDLEVEMEEEKAGRATDKAKIDDEIAVLDISLKEVKTAADKFRQREQGLARIEELKAEEKNLAAEYEKLESEIFITEQFIKAKVNLLTDRINDLFEIVRFKLFDIQVNGGISECCEITVNGVPYGGGLNNAGRINAGLDVCRTMQRFYGITAPVFIDNAEAVCELFPVGSQVIRLVVSEGRWLPEGHPEIPATGDFKTRRRGRKGEKYTEVFVPDKVLRVEV